jgi:hypothetical protein
MIPALFDLIMRIAGATEVDRRQFLDSLHTTLMQIGESEVRQEHQFVQTAARYGFENALEDIRRGLSESTLDERWLTKIADQAAAKYRARPALDPSDN